MEDYLSSIEATNCPNYVFGNTLLDGVNTGNTSGGNYAQLGYVYTGNRDGESTVDFSSFDSGGWEAPRNIDTADVTLTIWADRQTTPNSPFEAKTPHGRNGWLTGPALTAPPELGCEGVNGSRVDGSVDWRPADIIEPHSNSNNSAVNLW